MAMPYTDKHGQSRIRQSGPVTINPETAPVVREIFERVLVGQTLLSIAYELERRGVPTEKGSPWNSTCVSRMVRNPAYAGATRMYGEVVTWEGGHEPIISRETWEAAQAILARHVVVKQTRQITSWAEGLVEHACGRRMYLYLIRNRPTAPTPVTASFGCQGAFSGSTARCELPRRHLVAWKLEPAIRECLAADLAALLSMEDATARAHAVAGGDEAAKVRKALAARQRMAEHRHTRARERWLAGREPLAWMDEEDARLDAELAAIATERATLPAEPDANRFAATAARLGQAREAMAFASDDELRDVLEPLGRAVVSESGVQIRWFDPFATFISEPHVAMVPHWR
jgi:hypothetical protein